MHIGKKEIARSGHQSKSNDLPLKRHLHCGYDFEGSIGNSQKLMMASVPTKRISKFWFQWPEVRSVLYLTIIRQWENVEMPIIPKVRARACYLSPDILISGHSRWPLRSFNPMTSPLGHSGSYETNHIFTSSFWWNRNRVLEMVPMCFSRIDASTGMQHDLLG